MTVEDIRDTSVTVSTDLQHTKSRFTKVLVKYLWVGMGKLSKQALLLLGRDLGV